MPSVLACPHHLMPERSSAHTGLLLSSSQLAGTDTTMGVQFPAEHRRHKGPRPLSNLPADCALASVSSPRPAPSHTGSPLSESAVKPPRTLCISFHNFSLDSEPRTSKIPTTHGRNSEAPSVDTWFTRARPCPRHVFLPGPCSLQTCLSITWVPGGQSSLFRVVSGMSQ